MAQINPYDVARLARKIARASAVALLLAQTGVDAQTAAPKPPTLSAEAEKTHNELRALKATMERAINENDIDVIVANVTEDVVFTTMNGDVARGPADIRKYFESMMKGQNPRVIKVVSKFEVDELTHLYGNDLGVAFGSSKDHYQLRGGETFDVAARWSSAMVRRDGRWKIANFHYSTNMFDNPVLDAQRKYAIAIGAAIAVVLALLAFWLGRVSGRKSAP